eukprot:TRINITY_DN5404_c0_g2_i1.p1 TRINITY_DN5404_c0_g2~~TRINITY_DN5404_c0_g2_i1.p1  ORF type:complete len:139 (+),score=24.53 TRINITY_DN5404_c0_g2_i1:173-589(+)
MCIRDRYQRRVRGSPNASPWLVNETMDEQLEGLSDGRQLPSMGRPLSDTDYSLTSSLERLDMPNFTNTNFALSGVASSMVPRGELFAQNQTIGLWPALLTLPNEPCDRLRKARRNAVHVIDPVMKAQIQASARREATS